MLMPQGRGPGPLVSSFPESRVILVANVWAPRISTNTWLWPRPMSPRREEGNIELTSYQGIRFNALKTWLSMTLEGNAGYRRVNLPPDLVFQWSNAQVHKYGLIIPKTLNPIIDVHCLIAKVFYSTLPLHCNVVGR